MKKNHNMQVLHCCRTPSAHKCSELKNLILALSYPHFRVHNLAFPSMESPKLPEPRTRRACKAKAEKVPNLAKSPDFHHCTPTGGECRPSSPRRARNGSAIQIEIELPPVERSSSETKFPIERWKTFVALLFVLINFILTTTSLSITHELRRPQSKVGFT